MTNKEIAGKFDLLAGLLEIHDENPFKVRSYQNAYNIIRQIDRPVSELEFEELVKIKGIGKSIAQDIIELKTTSKIEYLDQLLEKTPEGILDIMKIKGIGPKKVRSLWHDLSVESPGELEYAIKENRLSLLKGFGEKTQNNILQQIEFLNSNKGKILFYKAQFIAQEVLKIFKNVFPENRFELTGEVRRMIPVISKTEIMTDLPLSRLSELIHPEIVVVNSEVIYNNYRIIIIYSEMGSFGSDLFLTTGPEDFVEKFKILTAGDENKVFELNSLPVLMPHLRDNENIYGETSNLNINDLVKSEDIRGVLHNHTVWSDGSDKLFDMASYYKELGYEYMLISDHSKSAFYANGVKENDIIKYIGDINETNAKLENFTVFAGIESDILSDGNLDYSDDILKMFDVIIASVHSGLQMDKNRATERLIKAIENPFTRILGHMTGRILLAREAYPLEFDKIFDACAGNNVAIELNCNPLRMDIDWTLISKAQEKGIKFCINPDAHSKFEVKYIDYGVTIAQKGGMLKTNCINAKNLSEFQQWIVKGKKY